MSLTPPPPLAWYQNTRLDPENIKRRERLKERLRQFRPMSKGEYLIASIALGIVAWRLNRRGWNTLKQQEIYILSALAELRQQLDHEHEKGQAAYNDGGDYQTHIYNGRVIRADIRRRKSQLQRLRARQEPLLVLYRRYKTLSQQLDHHRESVLFVREESRRRKEFRKELKITGRLIREVWANTAGCHYIKTLKNGQEKLIVPGFDLVQVQSHTLSFRIATAEQGLFGWRQTLPYRVNLRNLYDEPTLENIAAAIDRQVQFIWNRTHTRVILKVHRLDTPNGLASLIRFRTMMELYPVNDHDLLPYPIGVDENNVAQWMTFHAGAHLLIGGATRSGKSNEVNGIISSIIQTHTPDEVRFVLIDNKGGVEFVSYKAIPHLLGNVIKRVDDVLPALEQVIKVMERRLAMLESARAKNILEYNERAAFDQQLPRIIVVIDEMQTLLNRRELTRDIHQAIAVIGAQGAAVGIHEILCTQLPNSATIPPQIKANMTVRLAFKMPANAASMTVIDSGEASKIPDIKGRALLRFNPEAVEIQTALVTDSDIQEALDYASLNYGDQPLSFRELESVAGDEGDMAPVPSIPIQSVKPPFDLNEFIRISIEELGGKASPTLIHQILGDRSPGKRRLNDMLQILKQKEGIQYGDDLYILERGDRSSFVFNPAIQESQESH